jgi:hypothetical protein
MRFGRKKKVDHDLLSMALAGYEASKASLDDARKVIDQKILAIKKQLRGGGRAINAAVESVSTPKKRRVLSAKARASISRAQKKRWKQARKAAMKTVKNVKTKVKKTGRAVRAAAATVLPS